MNYIVISGGFLLLLVGATVVYAPNFSIPKDTGVVDSQLHPLRDTPNGVASVTNHPNKRVAPLPLHGSVDASFDAIIAAATAFGKVSVAERSNGYLHLIFTTPIMRFHDDVEWMVNDQGSIDVRSQSRTGKGDMGLNRRRYEHIETHYLAAMTTPKDPSGALQ